MVEWREEKWHATQDWALGLKKDVFVIKKKDIRWTTDHMLRLLWTGTCIEDAAEIYITVNEDEAFKNPDSFKERMRLVWNALEPWQRWLSPVVDCPEGSFGTGGDLVWSHAKWSVAGESRSWLMIRPATENAGAAGRYTDCVLDEMERYEDPDATFAGAVASAHAVGAPAICGGTLTLNSSPGSRLWQEYMLGQDGEAESVGLFFGWGSLEGETPERYAALESQYRRRGQAGLLELHRLYPRTPQEALSAFGKGLATVEALRECHVEKPLLEVPEGLRRWALV